MTVKDLWGLVKAAASGWVDDYAPSMGAALAYYTMFSIAPLLLIVISIAGLVFGEEAARGEIFGSWRACWVHRVRWRVQAWSRASTSARRKA